MWQWIIHRPGLESSSRRSAVEPTGHAVEGDHTVMRDDEPAEPMGLDDVLLNAPRREGDYFRVRAVME